MPADHSQIKWKFSSIAKFNLNGILELGSLGAWELGSLGAWELGSLGAWQIFSFTCSKAIYCNANQYKALMLNSIYACPKTQKPAIRRVFVRTLHLVLLEAVAYLASFSRIRADLPERSRR